jgi:ABC-2 type transport system permease protein
MFERIQHMLIKEFIQVFRDPRMKLVIFGMPVLQLLVFSYAVNTDVRNISTAIYDLDHSVMSRELVARFVNSGYFQITTYVADDRQARDLMDHGRVQAILQLNPGFENDLLAGKTVPFQVIVDGTNSNTAAIILSYSARIVGQFSQELLVRRITRLRGAIPKPGQIQVQTRAWFNENLESRYFFIPGVIVILLTLITLQLTSMAVVREKELGTMEQIIVTPIRPHEFILGKTIPFILIAFVDVIGVMVVAKLWFGLPIRGSLVLFFLACGIFLLTTLAVGLLISTVSETQQQAMMTTFFFFMPAMMLSGFVFPIANMPKVIQYLTYLDPLRYFLVIVRGLFLKGVGFDVLWPQMAALLVIGVASMALARARFRKTLV